MAPVSGGGSGDRGGRKRTQRPPPETLSASSGAGKQRVKKAAQLAAANPPSLSELIEAALPSFEARSQRSIYRSMVRVAVKKIDPVKPPRGFGDKDEWKAALLALQSAGKLAYSVESDTITLD